MFEVRPQPRVERGKNTLSGRNRMCQGIRQNKFDVLEEKREKTHTYYTVSVRHVLGSGIQR